MKKANDGSHPLKPLKRVSFKYRGVTYYTTNMGNIDPMTNNFVWFGVGLWTHSKAYGAFNTIIGAVADRMGLWKELNLAVPGLMTEDQKTKLNKLEKAVMASMKKQGIKV